MNEESTDKTCSISDFWLDDLDVEQYSVIGDDLEPTGGFTTDLIKLASYRKVVSNFVCILTNKNIPVHYLDGERSLNFTDGESVWLSSTVKNKRDFDWSVGLALHEGSHILLSDFNVVKSVFCREPFQCPSILRTLSKEKNLTSEQLKSLCKWVFNFVEDRYIDSYIFKTAPGYRGYYKSMYQKLWNSKDISRGLLSKRYRVKTLRSFEMRVLNLTNPNTDLDALPGLRNIAELLDIENILRLNHTNDRLSVAFEIVKIILSNINPLPKSKDLNTTDATLEKIHKSVSGQSSADATEKEPSNDGMPSQNSSPITDEDREEDESDDGENAKWNQTREANDLIKQRQTLNHSFGHVKKTVTLTESSILDTIEKNGIQIVPAGKGLTFSGNEEEVATDCIVVNKLTKELIDSGHSIFPMSAVSYRIGSSIRAEAPDALPINQGFCLGKLLGRRLQIRGEETTDKYIRKTSGKIERRLLSGIGAGMEDIFNRTITHKHNKARLHISVDASSSMSGIKWFTTMKCVTAICVAAAMIENLSISVSFRCTHMTLSGIELPYVVLAYDSSVDKISKVRNLFPYLKPHGCTPEGLAFEPILEKFIVGKHSTEQDHYFLNISDGEPYYRLSSSDDTEKYRGGFLYNGVTATNHTKKQVDKIRSKGIRILSYFIESDNSNSMLMGGQTIEEYKNTLRQQFQTMYGKDAQFINVGDVVMISKTINKLFIS